MRLFSRKKLYTNVWTHDLTSSPMRPIFMPERAKARRADWAPGPGVFVLQHHNNTHTPVLEPQVLQTTGHASLNMPPALSSPHTTRLLPCILLLFKDKSDQDAPARAGHTLTVATMIMQLCFTLPAICRGLAAMHYRRGLCSSAAHWMNAAVWLLRIKLQIHASKLKIKFINQTSNFW